MSSDQNDRTLRDTVERMLSEIEKRGEEAAIEYTNKLDDWTGDVVLSDVKRAQLMEQVPQQVCDDIQFAYDHGR